MATGAHDGGPIDLGVESRVPMAADRYADDLARLHRVATLPPAEPDERLRQWLEAGAAAAGALTGVVVVDVDGALVVRAVGGPQQPGGAEAAAPVLEVGAVIRDARVTTAIERQATMALLGGPAERDPPDRSPADGPTSARDLGSGTVVVSPLWVSGRLAGAVAFRSPAGPAPFSTWELALVDLVADGVARVLEHHADVRALDVVENRAAAVLDLIPDPVVRLDRTGHVVGGDHEDRRPFDPCALLRPDGEEVAPADHAQVREAIDAVVASGSLQSRIFASGPGPGQCLVEARFVPAPDGEVLAIVRDITERHRAEQARAEQVAFEALVTAISTRLGGCAPGELDQAIVNGLGEIASFVGADTALIDERSTDGSMLRLSHVWVRPGHRAPRPRGARVDLARLGGLAERFGSEGHVFATGTDHLPREATETGFVDAADRAALWVRLGSGDDMVGVLGLAWRSEPADPGEEVVSLVRFAADAFHGAIRRRSLALLAEGQARVFESIARSEPVATSLLLARDLLADHTLGAVVTLCTVDEHGFGLVSDRPDDPWTAWFADLDVDLTNPYGQAVVTGEPVAVVDAAHDRRFTGACVPDPAFRAASVLPVRSSQDGRILGLVILYGDEHAATVPRRDVCDSVLSLVTVALERDLDARRLAHQATHDHLTGVGNRAALVDRLHLVLARARRTGNVVAVLFCDLDDFKLVNDRYGHDRGDRLLVEVAERIRGAVRPSDTVSRSGGDEFVVVCEDLSSPDQAVAIVERVRAAISDTPVDLGGATHHVGVSIGLAIADPVLDDPDRLLRSADLAMYAEKQRERAGGFVIDLTDGSTPEPGTAR